MSDTTSILDLPTDPIVGSNNLNNNIQIKLEEKIETNNQPQQNMSLDQNTINQIVNGLQQASIAGVTHLPSRDIPMNTSNISLDGQSIPNYIPSQINNIDYIEDSNQMENVINSYNKRKKINNIVDNIYDEMQFPLLISILYFLFQLPFFKKFLYTNLSFLFSNDGNYNFNGFLFVSIFFGMCFYCLMKITNYFGKF